jgi:hypothetical protein
MLVAQTFHTFTPALTQKAHQETSIRGFCSCAIPPTSDWRQQGDFVLILHKRLDAFLVDVFLCYRVLLPPPLACLLYVVIVLVLLLSVHQLIVVLYLDPMRLVEKRGLTGCFLS